MIKVDIQEDEWNQGGAMDFATVKALADQALDDGWLSQTEIDEIIAAIEDGDVTPQELGLLGSIYAKIKQGEVAIESCQTEGSAYHTRPPHGPA